MAVSTIDIYNMALGWLGGHQLSSVQAEWEDSTIGRLCQTYFPKAVSEALTAHPWSFAAKSQTLARINSPGRAGYPYRFALPADFLTIHYFDGYEVDDGPHFIVEGDSLLTVIPAVTLIYTAAMEDPKKMSPAFVTALSYSLAAFLAVANNNDPQAQNYCQQKYMSVLEEAWARDQDKQNPRPKQSEWAMSRYGDY